MNTTGPFINCDECADTGYKGGPYNGGAGERCPKCNPVKEPAMIVESSQLYQTFYNIPTPSLLVNLREMLTNDSKNKNSDSVRENVRVLRDKYELRKTQLENVLKSLTELKSWESKEAVLPLFNAESLAKCERRLKFVINMHKGLEAALKGERRGFSNLLITKVEEGALGIEFRDEQCSPEKDVDDTKTAQPFTGILNNLSVTTDVEEANRRIVELGTNPQVEALSQTCVEKGRELLKQKVDALLGDETGTAVEECPECGGSGFSAGESLATGDGACVTCNKGYRKTVSVETHSTSSTDKAENQNISKSAKDHGQVVNEIWSKLYGYPQGRVKSTDNPEPLQGFYTSIPFTATPVQMWKQQEDGSWKKVDTHNDVVNLITGEPATDSDSANERQIGGDHYQQEDGGEQHWDRMWRLVGAGYFIGCITKYVERYQKKNGIEDLQKAKHYLQKLIELETAAAVRGE